MDVMIVAIEVKSSQLIYWSVVPDMQDLSTICGH